MKQSSPRSYQSSLFGTLDFPTELSVDHHRTLTQSKEEAFALLEIRRKGLLSIARGLAYDLGLRESGFTSQELLSEIENRKLFTDGDRKLNQRWIGTLWSTKEFKGDFQVIGYKMQKNLARNCHSKNCPIWRRRFARGVAQ